MANSANKWQAGRDGGAVSEVIDFGLVDAKGRAIGTRLNVQPRERGEWVGDKWTRTPTGTFSYSIQATRNGVRFGAIPRDTGDFATVEEAKVAAETAAERSRKAQARKYGATVDEAKAKQAEQNAKSAAKVAAWRADYDARMAQRQAAAVAPAPVEAPVAPAAVAPVVVEVAPVVEAAPARDPLSMPTAADLVAGSLEGRYPDRGAPAEWTVPEVARFRGFRDPDGALRFRRVEAAPEQAAPLAPAVETRCGTCDRMLEEQAPGAYEAARPGYACGTCGRAFAESPADEPLPAMFARLVHYATRHYADHVAGWSRFVLGYTFETFAEEARREGLRTFEEALEFYRRALRDRLDEEARIKRARAMAGTYYDADANLAE